MQRFDPRMLQRILECSVGAMEAPSEYNLLAYLRVLFFRKYRPGPLLVCNVQQQIIPREIPWLRGGLRWSNWPKETGYFSRVKLLLLRMARSHGSTTIPRRALLCRWVPKG